MIYYVKKRRLRNMKVYRIWCEERYTSGGFSEHDDYVTAMVFTTREKAYEHLGIPMQGRLL